MPTPTPATSPQVFSCCWSMPPSHHCLSPSCLCVNSSCSDPPWKYIPHKRLGHWDIPNTSPQHSLTLQGHSSFALSLCCAGRRTLSKKWMCCSLPGSPSPQWRTLTSQTGLERCRKDGELACVAEKKVNLSEIMMLQCYLVRVVKYRNQLPRQGMDSPALQRFKATSHSPGEPGQMRPALIRAEPRNFWKSFQLQLLSDNHFNNAYNTQQHHLAVAGSPSLQIYSPNIF